MTTIDIKPSIGRVKRDWMEIAGEFVEVEYIKGTFYGYCSELAALRLEHKYRNTKQARAAYSENLGTWYFRLETNLG
jgi:hypothetical protein